MKIKLLIICLLSIIIFSGCSPQKSKEKEREKIEEVKMEDLFYGNFKYSVSKEGYDFNSMSIGEPYYYRAYTIGKPYKYFKDIDIEKNKFYLGKNELIFKKFKDLPFTGNVIGRFQCKIIEGKIIGRFKNYYKSGQIKINANYNDNGVLDGFYIEFYKNGNIKFTGNFYHGKKMGTHITYSEDGKIKDRKKYKSLEEHQTIPIPLPDPVLNNRMKTKPLTED